MFSFIKEKIKSAYDKISSGISNLLGSHNSWDEETTKKLETILLESEFGSHATRKILSDLSKHHSQNSESFDAQALLKEHLTQMIKSDHSFQEENGLYFLCGINGSGKTTTAIKLALFFKNKNKKTLLIAADTFRAAAREQLIIQAQKHHIDIYPSSDSDNPSSAVYKGLQFAHAEGYERIIIDTAGRLQNKEPLMQELAKLNKVAEKITPEYKKKFLLTLDVTIGQNLFDQAELFNQTIPLDGLILTKFDALTRPGVVFSIVDKLKLPIAYITYGEEPSAISLFHAQELIDRILNT